MSDKEVAENIDARGIKTITADDTRCHVTERKLVFYLHNTWNDIGELKTLSLKKPDRYGVYSSAGSIEFDNFIAQEFVAVIVEFQIVVQNTKDVQMTFVVGYDTILPELNSIGAPKEMNVERKLLQGPGQSMRNQLVLDRELDRCNNIKFEFSIKCAVSTSQKAPRKTLSIDYTDVKDLPDKGRKVVRGDSFASLPSRELSVDNSSDEGYTPKRGKSGRRQNSGLKPKHLKSMNEIQKQLEKFKTEQGDMLRLVE